MLYAPNTSKSINHHLQSAKPPSATHHQHCPRPSKHPGPSGLPGPRDPERFENQIVSSSRLHICARRGGGWRCAVTGINISPLVSRTFVCAWDLGVMVAVEHGNGGRQAGVAGAGGLYQNCLGLLVEVSGASLLSWFEPFLPLGYPRHFAGDEAGRRPLTPLLPPHQGLPSPVKRLEMGDVFFGLLPMLNTAGLITGCKLCLPIVQALVKTPSTSWTRLLVESNAASPGTNIT